MSYAEEQLEHAMEIDFKCHNKKCDRCIDSKCTATNVYKVCSNYESKPINYEEEYYKLKKEHEGMKRLNFGLSDKLETIDDEYQEEIKEQNDLINKLKNRNDELQEKYNNLQLKIDTERLQTKDCFSKLEVCIKQNQELRETVKKLAGLL